MSVGPGVALCLPLHFIWSLGSSNLFAHDIFFLLCYFNYLAFLCCDLGGFDVSVGPGVQGPQASCWKATGNPVCRHWKFSEVIVSIFKWSCILIRAAWLLITVKCHWWSTEFWL